MQITSERKFCDAHHCHGHFGPSTVAKAGRHNSYSALHCKTLPQSIFGSNASDKVHLITALHLSASDQSSTRPSQLQLQLPPLPSCSSSSFPLCQSSIALVPPHHQVLYNFKSTSHILHCVHSCPYCNYNFYQRPFARCVSGGVTGEREQFALPLAPGPLCLTPAAASVKCSPRGPKDSKSLSQLLLKVTRRVIGRGKSVNSPLATANSYIVNDTSSQRHDYQSTSSTPIKSLTLHNPTMDSNGFPSSSSTSPESLIQVTRKRFLILFLFALYSMSNAFQWIEYSIVAEKISAYYSVTNLDVNWTSVFYMILYAPLVLPGTWILNRKGLRFCVLVGSAGTCLGSWIKCFSTEQSGFAITMIGQAIVAMSQIFILNLPPRIAAVWFGANEVSTATAFGVFGNQVGIAFGFLIPPLLFKNADTPDAMAHGLRVLFYSTAVFTSVLFFIKVILFDDQPEFPPSKAAALAKETCKVSPAPSNGKVPDLSINGNPAIFTPVSDSAILKSLMTNVNYVLLLITYGLNVGVFYAISTVLSQLVELRFPGHLVEAGFMGLLIIVAGIFGSVICGFILDATHKFKETTLSVYICSLFGMIAFCLALRAPFLWPLFPISGLLGFFMTGYLPIGFEFAAEVSYPNPEGTSAGLLNAAAQVFGMIFTFGSSALIDWKGDIAANLFMISFLIIGAVLTAFIKPDLRRLQASSPIQNPPTQLSVP